MSGAWLLSLALLFACANPEGPSGGPPDEVSPWLVAAFPESAAVSTGPIDELQFGFSEKMDRTEAYRWLTIFPKVNIRKTSWKGARLAKVSLEEALPADTVVVVELAPGMQDAHRVPQAMGRTFVFATGDTLYDGQITGELILDDMPLPDGVVEIIADGPDSVRLAQRPVLRRATTDSTGHWLLPWLPADGHGWLLRAYQDRNRDRRADDNEAQRLWPDTLRLVTDAPRLHTGLRVLYTPDTPGTMLGALADRPSDVGPVLAFTAVIADEDTGYVPVPQPAGMPLGEAVSDTGSFTLSDVGPGLTRAIFFVDLDGDSLFTAVGDTADTLWALEPWALVDSVTVEPGLPVDITAPVWPDTLTPWPAPAPVDTMAADSTATAEVDTTAVEETP